MNLMTSSISLMSSDVSLAGANTLLSASDWIQLIGIIVGLITSIVAIIISIQTLKQSNESILENSRANIVFYIDTLTGAQQYLVIKNFGNSIGRIISIEINPKPDYSKSPKLSGKPNPIITDYKNILLAPNQCIKSWFPFSNYPDKKFEISVSYETLGKTYTENYPIDLSYIEAIDYLKKTAFYTDDEKEALVDINNTLIRFSEKF